MDTLTSFDYLCDEPIFIDGIGSVKCPTLRTIRKTTYQVFSIYVNSLSISLDDYLKAHGLKEKYDLLSDEEKLKNGLFNLLLYGNTQLLYGVLNFFLIDDFEYNQKTAEIDIFNTFDDKKSIIGHLNSQNFDLFRNELQCVLGIKKLEESEPKFKNSLAEKMFAKLKTHNEKLKKKSDENYELDNMIKKYCTHNKVGINILNVWDMTYFQFMAMFNEYCNGRQYDFNDMMASNTFQYKKSSDYKPMDYMKILNK